ncbi:DUF3800 domain-containing protein [Neobacillus sp. MM2021_6]|uniref:DUF3800 domain-containing protein n=1 Tax=Bacillaceae TaxID=186817 RepID=UPI00140C3283|nr:DUF3800 domain-containing protein [Neobacillus sp. MM2021_6]NHC21218.1 DUF3800 domain-containing protein [Bacillus sp. MM2020_4]
MFNIYCDESCHLPNDNIDIMVLGAISCPADKKEQVYQDIREIKNTYGVNKNEIKWTKVSSTKIEMYQRLVEYFFKNDDLVYRAVVAKNKSWLDHKKFNNNDYDLWYYKMYYYLLQWFCNNPSEEYRIFIDIKDTKGAPRVRKLHEVLCNNKYDFKKDIIKEINQINSDRADILQLTDLLTGALSFYHRGLYENGSPQKRKLVDTVQKIIGSKIDGTNPSESKFNVFVWTPKRSF